MLLKGHSGLGKYLLCGEIPAARFASCKPSTLYVSSDAKIFPLIASISFFGIAMDGFFSSHSFLPI